MSDLPDPLVPADVDLRDFSFTPMFRGRLFGSSFHARVSDAGWRAGVTLWLKSWDQSPAGTLPDDEVDLCRLAELGRDLKAWKKLAKEALWGWFKCSDGRLHHRTVAEGVMEAWEKKKAQRDRTAKARATALSRRQSQEGTRDTKDDVTRSVTDAATEPVTDSKGQGQYKGQGKNTPAAAVAVSREQPPFEAECRSLVGQEPVLLAHDWHVVEDLLAEGLTPDDVRTGIAEALAKADPTYRFRAWRNFATWIRTAGKNRLASKARTSTAPQPRAADTPDDPPIRFPGGVVWPTSGVVGAVERWERDPMSWPGNVLGFPPGDPSCRVPDHLLPSKLRRATEAA